MTGASYNFCYGPHPGNMTRTGDRTRSRCVTCACYRLLHNGGRNDNDVHNGGHNDTGDDCGNNSAFITNIYNFYLFKIWDIC